jgi:ATP-dependent Clp protease ATP-binding subunit ClpC
LLCLQVITLDMGLLVAGTKYRGEFEERLKKLMDEIKQNDDIILVRAHAGGAGAAQQLSGTQNTAAAQQQ